MPWLPMMQPGAAHSEPARLAALCIAILLARGLATSAHADATVVSAPGTASDSFDPSGSGPVDTHVAVVAGQSIVFNATGTVYLCNDNTNPSGNGCPSSPGGTSFTYLNLPSPCSTRCVLPTAYYGTLLYRIGDGPYIPAVYGRGAVHAVAADRAGEVFLAVNDDRSGYADNSGAFGVNISTAAPTPTPYPTSTGTPQPTYTPVPTYTYAPSATTAPPPSPSPYPTSTARPTYTPVPPKRRTPIATPARGTSIYFAGGEDDATTRATLTLLNRERAAASVRLDFYVADGKVGTVTLTVPRAARRVLPVARLVRHADAFGLAVTSSRRVTAGLTLSGHGGRAAVPGDVPRRQRRRRRLGGLGLRRAAVPGDVPRRQWSLTRGYTTLRLADGLAVLNPAPRAARVTVRLRSRRGDVVGTVAVVVPAHADKVATIGRLLPGVPVAVAATSDRPVVIARTALAHY